MRFEIDVQFLLLSFVGENGTAVDDESVRWYSVVELETLLSGGDGAENRESIDTRFDVGGWSATIIMSVCYTS